MKIFRIIVVTLFLLGVFVNHSFAIADKDGPKIGDVPPPLTLTKTIQGPPATELNWDKLKGKVVVLEFWATWCGPCIKAIPHLNDLAEQFKGKPVVFISVTSENEDVVRLFLKNHSSKAWIGLDDYEVLNQAFHVEGIPHAVIVDATGHIAAITHPAEIKPENLEEVLAGKKCSLPLPAVYTIDKFSKDEVVTNQAPPLFEISIREHKMPQNGQGPICIWSSDTNGCEFKGKIATVESALDFVFDKNSSRTLIKCKLPDGYYDFELRAPSGHADELKKQFIVALRTTFGLDVKQTTNVMNAYVLTQINTNAPGLRKVEISGGGGNNIGRFRLNGTGMKVIADYLEIALGKPVFDETGLKGLFDVDMKWKLSEAEQLEATTGRKVWQAINANPNGDWISTLPEELRTGEALENDKRLQAELAKPEAQQFQPDPDAVIAAARERLGLQLTLAQRSVEILEVSEASQ
ncbi:MAG TPA: TIGR03435 family protein [Verrucomicrobiae bacterium]